MSFATSEPWTASDGTRLALRREDARGVGRGTLIFVHGWGDYAGRHAETALWFAERGITAIGADLRGHGASPGRRGHVERFAQYLADIVALRKLAAATAPQPQLLLGHSFGAFIVLRYLETAPEGLAGAIAAAPYIDLYRPPDRWKVRLALLLQDVAPSLPIDTGLGWDQAMRDPVVWESYLADPLAHQKMTPRAYAEALAALAVLHAEKDRIAAPVLFLLAGEDRIVSTPAADAFARSLHAPVTVRTYPALYHAIFHEPDREPVFADVAAWLDGVLAAA